MALDRDTLFLETLDDLRQRITPPVTEYDIVMTTPLLRKLLYDTGTPLIAQVNRTRRLKIRFRFYSFASYRPGDHFLTAATATLADGIDPANKARTRGLTIQEGTLAQFLRAQVIRIGSEEFTVKHLLDHAAYVIGGVHAGEANDEQQVLHAWHTDLTLGGAAGGLREIRGIVGVTLKAVNELEAAIRADSKT